MPTTTSEHTQSHVDIVDRRPRSDEGRAYRPAGEPAPATSDAARERALSAAYNCAQPMGQNVAGWELMVGLFLLLLWVIFFGAGLFVPTATLRNTLWAGGTGSLSETAGIALLVGAGYTLTNILFLAALASLMGSMAHRWQVGDGCRSVPAGARPVASKRIYLSAVLRGFFLYVMFISGFLLVSTEETVTNTEFAQYIRIAGMISVVGFIVGYDPNLLIRLMRRILSLTNLVDDEGGARAAPARPGRAEA